MSLFERPEYEWRETFFVLFDAAHRPQASALRSALENVHAHLKIEDLREDEEGRFESITILDPDDYAAMDVTCVVGEEVREQVTDLIDELKPTISTDEEKERLRQMANSSARLDVFHFEQHATGNDEDDDDFMDPGGVLIVLDELGKLCGGVVVDPQSGTLM